MNPSLELLLQRKSQLQLGNLRWEFLMVVSFVNQNFGRQVAETYRKQETVVNFDTTSRRGGSEVREDYCFLILKKIQLLQIYV